MAAEKSALWSQEQINYILKLKLEHSYFKR